MSNEEEFIAALDAKLSDLTERRASFKGIIYGESGVGKTVASMQLAQDITPEGKYILLIDSGMGWASLNNHPHLKKRVKAYSMKGMSELDSIAAAVSTEDNGFWSDVGSIVIDEYSTYAEYDVLAVTKARAVKSGDKNADEPKLPDMGVSSNRMIRFSGPLIQLPDVHIIFVAHQRTDKDNMQRETISPAFMPKFNSHIRGKVHLVGYMTADEGAVSDSGEVVYTREVQVQPTKGIIAKTRIGGFPIRVSADDLCNGVKEWLTGDREEQTTHVIHDDPVVEVKNSDDNDNDLLDVLEN